MSDWIYRCSVCDGVIASESTPCPFCASRARTKELRAIVAAMLPWVRLYEPPDDSPDYAKDARTLQRLVRRAERAVGQS